MKMSRFSEAQLVGLLKEVELGAKVSGTCRKHGVSEPMYYKWKGQFSGMTVCAALGLRDRLAESLLPLCENGRADRCAQPGGKPASRQPHIQDEHRPLKNTMLEGKRKTELGHSDNKEIPIKSILGIRIERFRLFCGQSLVMGEHVTVLSGRNGPSAASVSMAAIGQKRTFGMEVLDEHSEI